MKDFRLFLFISVCVFLLASSTAYAAGDTLVKTEIFHSDSSEFGYDFEDEIEENGRHYKLGKVDYTVLSQHEETELKHEIITEAVDDLYEAHVVSPANKKAVTIDGKKYEAELEDIRYESTVIKNRTAEIETIVKLTEDKITEHIEYQYEDVQAKQSVTVNISKKSVTETNETKEITVTFPVVFHRYDSEEFLINGKLIPLQQGDTPINEQYFGDLKAESAYADKPGTITDLRWSGEPYISGGETCRNALASLTESRRIYAVKYSDTVDLPDTEGYRAILSYGTDVRKPTGRITYEVQAKAEYILIEGQDVQPLFIGIAIFALAAAVILFIIAKRRKNKAYTI